MRDDIGNKKKVKSQGPQESSLLPPPCLALSMDELNHTAVFLSIFLILYVFKVESYISGWPQTHDGAKTVVEFWVLGSPSSPVSIS